MPNDAPPRPSVIDDELKDILRKFATAYVSEIEARRRDSSWNLFRRITVGLPAIIVSIVVLVALCQNWLDSPTLKAAHEVAVVRIDGDIEAGGNASAAKIVPLIDKAFNEPASPGFILAINSPGGSPSQAGMIRDEIDRMRVQHPDKRVIAVGEDLMASAAYLIASGADKIYVQNSTLTGSIGVIYEKFGFDKVLDKVGVEPRILTAGINKDRMSQFKPVAAEDRAKIQSVLDHMHLQFEDYVKKGRGARLKPNPDLFTGDFWTGDEAVAMGLADAVGSEIKAASVEFARDQLRVLNGAHLPSLWRLLMPDSMLQSIAPPSGPQEMLLLR